MGINNYNISLVNLKFIIKNSITSREFVSDH